MWYTNIISKNKYNMSKQKGIQMEIIKIIYNYIMLQIASTDIKYTIQIAGNL